MSEIAAGRRVRRDGIVVAGPDAAEWLQGQVTQDLSGMQPGESRFSLVLSPQGKLESFCRVTRQGEESFLIDTEAGFGEALEARLRRFKLRVKAEIERVALSCEDDGSGRLDGLGPPEPGDPVAAEDDGAGEEARIRAGLPRLGRELTERTIPQEAGAAFVARTVSFQKGCYTGQELVARLDARGAKVPRQLRLIEGDGPGEPPAPGTEVLLEGEEVGQVTSAAPSGDSFVALGYLKRSVLGNEPFGATLASSDDRQQPVTVRTLPDTL